MKEEYTRETYPSFGKKYNGEKAIISLTSWRARINTVSKTLFSLLKQCPGFHIVLVLSEEEFPKMMDELPENLKVFAENELIEIMYVSPDYKVFMKTFFTMDKYRDVPVISADDDCIYTCNYAQLLYNEWTKHKDCVISNDGKVWGKYTVSRGQNTLFTYTIMKRAIQQLKWIFKNDQKNKEFLTKRPEDDAYNSAFYYLNAIKVIFLHKKPFYIYRDKMAINETALHNRIQYKEKASVELFEKILRNLPL